MLRKKRVTLTEDAAAAIAAGVPVEQAVATHPAEPSADTEAETLAAGTTVSVEGAVLDPPLEEGQAQDQSAAASQDDLDDEDEQDPNIASAASDQSTLTTLLNKVGTLQTELAESNLALKSATASLEAVTNLQASFMDIARTSISRMAVPLGGAAPELSHLNAEQLLTQYDATSSEFLKRFPIGGKAEVKVEDERNSDKVVSIAPAVTRATAFKKGG